MAAPLARCVRFSVRTAKTCISSRPAWSIRPNLTRPAWLNRPHNTYTCITVNSVRRLATDIDESPATEVRPNSNNEDPDELMRLRDVSRMPDHHARKMIHRMKPPDMSVGFSFMETKDFRRRVYAKYGKSSGIDPGIMWPSKEELAEINKVEKEYPDPTLRFMRNKLIRYRYAKLMTEKWRAKQIEEKMKAMPRLIEGYKKRILKEKAAEQEAERRRKEMIEEARDHFGYHVHPSSDKFKTLMAQKAADKKKQKRQDKKQKKEQYTAAGELKEDK